MERIRLEACGNEYNNSNSDHNIITTPLDEPTKK